MNRLQKKCFIAAGGLHLLLFVILLVGPAFISAPSTTEDVPVLEFLPDITTDANAAGGGPKGVSANPTQPPRMATPLKPVPVEDKTPPAKKEKIEEVTPRSEKTEISEPTKTRKNKIEVNTVPITRGTDFQAAAKARAEAAAARAATDDRRRKQLAFNRALSNISENMSGGTEIKLSGGNGSGGPSYGNWLSAVKKTYTDAWIVPDGVTDDSATVTASVTIARNGEVLSTSILKSSGNALVDHSVKATLERVTNAPRLPEGAKEDQRTVTINFNVKAKQGLG